MARVHQAGVGCIAVVIAAALAGCTPSVDPAADPASDPFAAPIVPGLSSTVVTGGDEQSGLLAVTPRRGSGTVTVAVPAGQAFSDELARDFLRATGFTLVQVEIDDDGLAAAAVATPEGQDAAGSADVLIGLDATDALTGTDSSVLSGSAPEDAATPEGTELAGAPGAIAYARDDVCVLADTQWFAANKIDPPSSVDDLASSAYAPLLEIPDPSATAEGRAFVQLTGQAKGDGASGWWAQLLASGAQVQSGDAAVQAWTAASASGARPLLVAPESLAATTVNNTATESSAAPVGSTCLTRYLYAARTADPADPDGAESFLAYLLGARAQQALAEESIATPLVAAAAQDTPIGWFSTPTGDAVALSEEDLGRTKDWLAAWEKELSSR
ncbi:substrate-binding domain-containing protein [Schaalia naturae]|uniref:Substrate-binding domain-containing protein n=1 Tax=Schaalia naturae TaxID=635203 RepID=A0ABW2SHV8_9ACTO